ncbi:DUF4381 domain-containing protein [Rheinheimera sp. NSM]|uniref:DUF4381 domain-containing protein n=1 Tax=Rheinheimera sp. NSM TaxID=3457884 RepID=UPI0040371EAE
MADTALEQLADISEPALQLSFALAPLWWLLAALLLATIIYLLLWAYSRRRYFAAKRQAQQMLDKLWARPGAAVQINQLIKRVLQHYQPGHPALSLPTQQWQHWLATQHSAPLPDLTSLLYRADTDSDATEQLYQFAKAWLAQYRGKAAIPTNTPEAANA